MQAKRIIPCLDVKDGVVVKGVNFKNHRTVGNIIELAQKYCLEGADELVFYDITASSENRTVDKKWVRDIAENLSIPFCVAGGIRTSEQAKTVLNYGADKISINSPALENPKLISELADIFGVQCVVVGIDSKFEDNDYYVYQYTGSEKTIRTTKRKTADWAKEARDRGAGEIVLNCMNSDGVKSGYDIRQLNKIGEILDIPLIASGGAGVKEHFVDVFKKTTVSGALAASVFHNNEINIGDLKRYAAEEGVCVRL